MAHAIQAAHEETAAPSLTYAEWRKRAREKLAGPTIMRGKAWTHLFITGKTPDEAADQANVHYSNSRVRPRGRR